MTDKKFTHQSFPLQLSFLIFSMLLNCMGIIILKYSGTHVSFRNLGILESFKDIPIVLVSMLSVNLINRAGTKKSLMIALFLVFTCCSLIPFLNEFWFLKLWFVIIGISFAIAKISVFAIIRNNEKEEKQLSKVMSRVEASFMIGIFCVNMGFGWLLSGKFEEYWKFGFWFIGLLSLYTIWKLKNVSYEESSTQNLQSFKGFMKNFSFQNILFFIILFLIVLLEQCLNSWLPTFYKKNLNVTSFYALQSSAFLAFFSFIGRYVTSRIIGRFTWQKYIFTCLCTVISLMFLSQLLVNNVKENLWVLLFVFPVLGLFTAPLYPLYNSKFLINIPTEKINITVSLIMIVSSLGSSVGSIGMSLVFHYGLDHYFILFATVPLLIILFVTLIFFQRLILRQ